MGSVLLSAPGLFNYIQSLTVEHSHNLRYALTDVVQSAVQENPANIVIDYIDMIYPS